MKNIYLSLGFVLAVSLAQGQNKQTRVADKLFERYEYVEAAQEYLKLADKGDVDT